jgi:hypothetical protein
MNPVATENKPEVKNEQQQTQQPVAQTQTVSETAPPIKSEENQANWKAFREQRENERKAREASERIAQQKAAEAEALRAALEALTNKPAQGYQQEEREESEDERIDKRVKQIIAEREAQAEQTRQQREKQEFPQRLNNTYGDFNKVCSSENLDYLEYHYPEVAAPFKHLPDGYDKWAGIYKAVKRFVPNVDAKHDSKKAEQNLQKPGSASSPAITNGGNAIGAPRLDEARKQANWDRMQRLLKGLT